MEREPELIFVKEEAYDDHPIGQQMMTDNRKSKIKKKKTKQKNLKHVCDLNAFILI